MLPDNHILDHIIKKKSLENPKILQRMSFKLMAWNQDENFARENKFNCIHKDYHNSEGLS